MTLIPCKECSKEISELAPTCPHCGAPNTKGNESAGQRDKPRSTWKLIFGIPAGAFVLFFVYGMFASQSPEQQEKFSAREHISTCWKDQARKSHDPAMARFVASTCEMLEEKFFTKYGHRP